MKSGRAIRWRIPLRHQVTVVAGAALVLLWLAVAWNWRATEMQAIEQVRVETAALALVFAKQADTTFRTIDHSLVILRDRWQDDPKGFSEDLAHHQDLLGPVAAAVLVLDGDGNVQYSDRPLPAARGDLVVQCMKELAAGAHDRMFVGRPARDPVSRKWVIPVGRPFRNTGRHDGGICITIDADHFVRFYQDAGLGKDGAARMIRDTGEVMARSSDADRFIGTVLTNASPYRQPGAPVTGSFRRAAQVDGVERLSSYHRIPDYGVTVVIGPSLDEKLAPTRRQQVYVAVAALLVSLLVVAFALQLRHSIARNDRARSALQDQKERLALATLHNGVGIWDWNPRTRKMIWDDSMFALYGRTREGFPGTEEAWHDSLHPEDRERAQRDLDAALRDERPFNTKFRVITPDGAIRHIRAVAKVFFDDAGRPERMLGTNVDITRSVEAEQARSLAEANARRVAEAHSEELERRVAERTADLDRARIAAEAANVAKTAFLAVMSHELRTPLNGVMGMIELAQRRVADARVTDCLAKAQAAARHLLELLGDILDTARIDSAEFSLAEAPFTLADVFARIRSLQGPIAAGKGLALNVVLPPPLADRTVVGDALRIGQILNNLVGNAIKFTPSGTVTLRAAVADEGPADLVVRFEVEDTGIGISAEDCKRLFRSFAQVDMSLTRPYGGTGLGLYIARRLAERMGGTIDVESTPGTGSTFWCTVGLKKSGHPDAGERGEAGSDAERELRRLHPGARVLVVDDDPLNRDVVCDQLANAGLAVTAAADGEAALALVEGNRYDAILMDVKMPRMDGLEATRRIRRLPAGSQVVILGFTALAFPEDRARCLDAGMNDCLVKPVAADTLCAMLLRWWVRSDRESNLPDSAVSSL